MKNTVNFCLQTLLLSLLFLGGCTHHQEEFECPSGKGIGCKSITDVKKMLNQGEIEIPETTTEAYQKRGSGVMNIRTPLITNASFETMTPIAFVDQSGMMIQRTPEKPLRIWIAPYQDMDGNFRESSLVHAVVQGGYWQMSPAKDVRLR